MSKAIEVTKNGKTWNTQSIKELLNTNNKAVERAISLIYSYQTLSEQSTGNTNTINGVGFNKFDANLLTSFAIQLKYGKQLSAKQLEVGRNKIKKYSNQILRVMANQQ